MESLKELYKSGPGPSSSHTLAPRRASLLFMERVKQMAYVNVELYGSLSLTGKGHYTDKVIIDTFAPTPCNVEFKLDWEYPFPNGLIIRAFDEQDQLLLEWVVYSIGGGSIMILNEDFDFQRQIYPHRNLEEIMDFCSFNKITLPQFAFTYEPDLPEYLSQILNDMLFAVKRGLEGTGLLPGKLKMPRVAKSMMLQANILESHTQRNRMKLLAYAYANNEENASLGKVVTAPTLGASGVMAALMYHCYNDLGYSRAQLINALAVGGIIGNVVKTNATISGAVGGCQAEIGVACAMAAASMAYLEGGSLKIIEYAAEIGMEHHLGLTCDPVGGYVIIPCIERNGAAVLRAIDAAFMAKTIGAIKPNRVSFDMVIRTMNYTGAKIAMELKETSLGGLATECTWELPEDIEH